MPRRAASPSEDASEAMSPRGRRPPTRTSLVIGLVVVALNLRLAIAAVSPVLVDIQADLRISSAVGGLLTTVPVLCFGAFAFVTPRLLRWLGMELVIWLTMVVLVGGTLLRLVPSLAGLFTGTVVIGASIAVANTAIPSLIKRDFADRVGLFTGIYSMSISASSALSAGLTVPLMHAGGFGWRPGLALWAVPAAMAVGAWAPQLRRPTVGPAVGPSLLKGGPSRRLRSDPLAWMVTGFMGLQSLGFYATLSWIPTLLEDHGMAAAPAGAMVSLASVASIVVSFATPMIARRLRLAWVPVVISLLLCAIGYAGLTVDPVGLAPLWMVILGAGQGASLSLALTYIVLRSPDSDHVARLSTMAQGCGYLVASIGPFAVGAIHDLTGGWTVPMLALTVLLVPELLAGLGASRNRYVLASPGE